MSAGAGNPAVESLATAALVFLRRFPPFDEMEERPLRGSVVPPSDPPSVPR